MSNTPPPRRGAAEIQQWLVDRLARLLKVEPATIDPAQTFDRLGLDSATAVGITLDLEDFLGRDVDPAVLYDYSTIEKLAAYLADTGSGADGGTDRATGGS